MTQRIFKTDDKVADLLTNTKQNGACNEWTRCFNTDGYPRMAGNVKVHRLMYELVNQKQITGLLVRHTCDNIKCINPDHLLTGSFADNNKDRVDRDRSYRTVTKAAVLRVNELLATGKLSQKEIATLVGIDPRRVSDIKRGVYCSATGKFLGHDVRRF